MFPGRHIYVPQVSVRYRAIFGLFRVIQGQGHCYLPLKVETVSFYSLIHYLTIIFRTFKVTQGQPQPRSLPANRDLNSI
jgi:hypothetical protein